MAWWLIAVMPTRLPAFTSASARWAPIQVLPVPGGPWIGTHVRSRCSTHCITSSTSSVNTPRPARRPSEAWGSGVEHRGLHRVGAPSRSSSACAEFLQRCRLRRGAIHSFSTNWLGTTPSSWQTGCSTAA